ncbi:MAG: hypothetical protein EOO40_01635 [Deltaproteobacteria bacterium]|nr:MAG: hypothetical protein EOO40_01635 [Deltaproteobacteria bacterium]
MAELLLRAYLPPKVSDLLDYASLRSESPKQHDEDGRLRIGDLLFSVDVREQRPRRVWIAILLEMQSSCDPMMAWRMLSYGTLFWRRLEDDKRLQEGLLPAVLPVVLYNGRRPWAASTTMHGCVNISGDSPLWEFTPNMRYLLIDIRREDPQRLWQMDNPVGFTMLLEQASDRASCVDLVRRISASCAGQRGLLDALNLLVGELMLARLGTRRGVHSQGLKEEELKMSLAETFAVWTDEWLEEGRQKGPPGGSPGRAEKGGGGSLGA